MRFLVVLFFLLSSTFALTLPPNLQAAAEQTLASAKQVDLLVAFVGGVLSLLSPCILAILPAFFAFTFTEKKNLVRATFLFFLGFSLVFVLMGVTAFSLGSLLRGSKETLTLAAGLLMIFLGSLILSGRGFSLLAFQPKKPTSSFGIFLLGVLMAIGWTPCIGPTLGAILVLASTQATVLNGGLLLFVYSLGYFIPFFLAAYFFDRFPRGWFLSGIQIGKRYIAWTQLLSGLLMIGTGLVFLLYRGTSVVNGLDPIGTKRFFYEWQRLLVGAPWLPLAAGAAALLLLFVLLKQKWALRKPTGAQSLQTTQKTKRPIRRPRKTRAP